METSIMLRVPIPPVIFDYSKLILSPISSDTTGSSKDMVYLVVVAEHTVLASIYFFLSTRDASTSTEGANEGSPGRD